MMKILMALLIMFLTTDYLLAETIKYQILKMGNIDNSIYVENTAIKNNEGLEKIRKSLHDSSLGSGTDLDDNMILLITAANRNAVDIKIDEIERRSKDTIEVIYSVSEMDKTKLKKLGMANYPYLALLVPKTENSQNEVLFRENLQNSPITSDTALDEDYKYSNILTTYQNLDLLDYMPLDVGNKWTYRIESGSKNYELSQEVQSVSNGWSILNTYFGKPNIALKIEQAGQLMVSSKEGGLRTFYNNTVIKSFISQEFKTPAGDFNDLMIVTVPENSKFWFKDIYAKNVGLIYHEHKSKKGNGKYTLLSAYIRGKSYPK